jgi:threonine aldolase
MPPYNATHKQKGGQTINQSTGPNMPYLATTKPQPNAVFALIPKEWIAPLQAAYFFYVWDENRSEVRWMTSFEIHEFVAQMRRIAELKG